MMSNRYLVILDDVGMISDILINKEDIVKYLENESNSEAPEGKDEGTGREV